VRRIFVGDLQGCLAPLNRLLEALELHGDDQLYCAGDLVNRGPDSLGVLRRLRDIGARSVLGNHDLLLLRLAAGTSSRPVPPLLAPVLRAPDATPLLEWLAAHPIMIVEPDVVVVHAGLHPHWTDLDSAAPALNASLREAIAAKTSTDVAFATEVRHCTADGARPAQDEPPPGPPYMPWDHWYRGSRTAVFGHWARRGLVSSGRVRGLDSGCVYGGPLTAWIAEDDRFVQAPGQDVRW